MPGEPLTVPARSLVREPVLEHAVHHRLGVGERRDAVADVADGRDPELAAEHAGRAAVVGNGDDRREVARVLLEPAQQRRQPGPAADRHDPGPAGQEALLVDDLDQRLASVVRAERVHECPDDHHRADRHAGEADARDHEDPGRGRQKAQGQEVDQRFADPARLQLARSLAEGIRERQRKEQETHEDEQHPALDADPGGQPAPQVHVRSSSRWKTATGP